MPIIKPKLKNALETGAVCGLETVGESILNTELHIGQIMSYTEIPDFLKDFNEEIQEYIQSGGSLNDRIPEEILKEAQDEQDYGTTPSDSSEQKTEDNSIFG